MNCIAGNVVEMSSFTFEYLVCKPGKEQQSTH